MKVMKRSFLIRPLDDIGVAEVFSSLLMMSMAVTLCSSLSLIILSPWSNFTGSDDGGNPVLIRGSLYDNIVILEHYGGEPLTAYKITYIVTDENGDKPPVHKDQKDFSDSDNVWEIGEERRETTLGDLTNKQVHVVIVDSELNCIVYDKIFNALKSGCTLEILDPNDIPNGVTESSAIIKIVYNYDITLSQREWVIIFTYYSEMPEISNPTTVLFHPHGTVGTITYVIDRLNPSYYYICNASFEVDGQDIRISDQIAFWSYSILRGSWPCNESIGETTLHDFVHPFVHGTLYGAQFGNDPEGFIQFNGEDEYVDIPHHLKWNLSDRIMIKFQLNPGQNENDYLGEINNLDTIPVVSDLHYQCNDMDVIQISHFNDKNIFAFVFHNNTKVFVMTLNFQDDGTLNESHPIINVTQFLLNAYTKPDIIHVNDNVYAIASGAYNSMLDYRGNIITITISDEGVINPVVLDILPLPITNYAGEDPCLLHVADTLYMVSYGGGYNINNKITSGYLFTFSINSTGVISDDFFDMMKIDQEYCGETDIIELGENNNFGIIYNTEDDGDGGGTFLKTIHVRTDTGEIITLNDFSIDSRLSVIPKLAHVTDDLYVMVSGGTPDKFSIVGEIITLRLSSDGSTLEIIDTFTGFPTQYASQPLVIPLTSGIFSIPYTQVNSGYGMLFTIQIDEKTGIILKTILDSYDYNTTQSGLISGYATFFGTNKQVVLSFSSTLPTDGFVSTVNIDIEHSIPYVMKKGSSFEVQIKDLTLFVYFWLNGMVYSCSGLCQNMWNEVEIVFGTDQDFSLTKIRLTISGEQPSQLDIAGIYYLDTNSDVLTLGGGFSGRLRTIQIHHDDAGLFSHIDPIEPPPSGPPGPIIKKGKF